MSLYLPPRYRNLLGSVEQTEKAIKAVKDMFQDNLSAQLALLRVTAPMTVLSGTGINDDLNGVERPVRFPVLSASVELLNRLTALMTFWRYSGVALYIPHRVIARVMQDILFMLMMSVLPGGTSLLVVRYRKELVKACKSLFSGMFLPVAATLLLFCIFYGDMTIKRIFPWWNLWGMWFGDFILAILIICLTNTECKDNMIWNHRKNLGR